MHCEFTQVYLCKLTCACTFNKSRNIHGKNICQDSTFLSKPFFRNLSCQTRAWLIWVCGISPSVFSVLLITITFHFFHVISLPANHDLYMCQKKMFETNVQSWSLGFVLHTVYFYNAILLLWKWTKTNCELVIHIQVCSPGHTWNNPTDAWLFILNSHWYMCCNDWP